MKRMTRNLPAVLTAGVSAMLLSAAGCARPGGVPPFTELVAESPGQAVTFEAPDEGTVWVAGPGGHSHIVYSGLVRRGDTITVDPSNRQMLVAGKPVDVTIEGRSTYQVWYRGVWHDWLTP